MNIKFSIEEITNKLKNRDYKLVTEYGTINLKTTSIRTFSKGCDCVECGAVGVYFELIKNNNGYSIQLVAQKQNKNKTHVVMTSDHIVPKSKGGVNRLDNRQPMCKMCNKIKGSHPSFKHAILSPKPYRSLGIRSIEEYVKLLKQVERAKIEGFSHLHYIQNKLEKVKNSLIMELYIKC